MAEHPLSGLGSATVHEAAGQSGALPSAIKPIAAGMYVCGPAFTVACPARDNLWLHRAIYAAPPGSVLIASTAGEAEAGYWGEVLTVAALARGLTGLVIAGGVRDTNEIGALGFPVFAASVCIRGTSKAPNGQGSLGQRIRIGEVQIEPGDAIIGDADGVAVIQASGVRATAAAAKSRVKSELSVIERLRGGETTLEIFDLPA